jgi:arsenate reductase
MKKVLFVCIGNSCRSQMAEGFARAYGAGVVNPMSAGLYPATSVSRLTREVMADRRIDISDHFPKGFGEVPVETFDIVVNMSGHPLPPELRPDVLEWTVDDPMGFDRPVYEEAASHIEGLVRNLIEQIRSGGELTSGAG